MLRLYLAMLLLVIAAPASAKIVTEAVPYSDGDVELEGYLAYDDTHKGPRPAVVVVHEWWGLNDYAKQQVRRLATLGYVAFALDMYGKDKVTEDPQQAGKWARAIYADQPKWRQRAKAGFDVLADHPRVDKDRIAAIGYCFGGSTVQQMALSGLPLQGVVSFHGNPVPATGTDARQTRARILILHGAADTLVSEKEFNNYLDAMRKTDIDWQVIVYSGAKHSFTNPKADDHNMEGVGYDKKAAERSWRHMRLFFAEIFKASVTIDAASNP